MKPFRMFIRSIRDAFKSVFRNFSLSLASISCITITLLVVAIALMGSLNIKHFTKNIKEDVTIVVYTKDEYDSEKSNITKAKIEQKKEEKEEGEKKIKNIKTFSKKVNKFIEHKKWERQHQ